MSNIPNSHTDSRGASQSHKPEPSVLSAKFDLVWKQYHLRIWKLVAHLSGSPDHADDLAQEVWLRALQGFGNMRQEAETSTWLFRIAVNVVHTHRAHKTPQSVPLDDAHDCVAPAGDHGDPQAAAIQADLRTTIWRRINALPEEARNTLILQVYAGFKHREIAAILDIPIGTVASRLHYALQRLRKELAEDGLQHDRR